MNRDDAALVSVVLAERCCQCVEKDAALDEVVEEDGALADAIELSDQHFDQPVWQAVAEGRQCSFQFIFVDWTWTIGVETSEAVLPVGDVSGNHKKFVSFVINTQFVIVYSLPERPKILEIDLTRVLFVKHSDHQTNCLLVERCPCAVGQSCLKLISTYVSWSVTVDSRKF